jgi:tripartite-type tricarboxylate transporter receptor subunit TctC
MRKFFTFAVAIAPLTLAGFSSAAVAQSDRYPTKSVRLLIPVPPGGGTDFLGRLLGQKLTDNLGQAFVIDNRGGAAGAIASLAVAKAVPDGYTLLFGYTAPLGINPALSKLPYDPVTDFSHISLIATATNLLVVNPSVPVKSVQELIDYAKSRPKQLRYASAGSGSAPHMSGELFNYMTGTSMIHVPYKGIGPALIDVLGGHVELTFASLPSAMPHGKAGRLRMLAVTGLKRALQLPDIPTVSECGLKGFNTDQWYGVLAPPQTTPALIAKLHKEVLAAIKSADFTERAQGQGFDVLGSTPAEFTAHIRAEVAKWSKLVKDVGIKAE